MAAAGADLALILASAGGQIRQQDGRLAGGAAGQLAPGQSLHGRQLGLLRLWKDARQVAGYARAFGMEVVWWAVRRGARARAMADGERVRGKPGGRSLAEERFRFGPNVRLKPKTAGDHQHTPRRGGRLAR